MSVPILTACAGFLIAVLWMDLMFDSQAGLRGPKPDESVLASIGAYYYRATTSSQPRGTLIATVMGALLVCLGIEAWRGGRPGWVLIASAVLAGGPILLALLRTVPGAVRLGRRADTGAEQSRLARSVYRDHLVCLAGMTAFLLLWLVVAVRSW
jgi:hypothetical protein